MAGYWLRLTVLSLIASATFVAFALLVGQQVETETVTEYFRHENPTYTLLIRDSGRNLHLDLAGKRCFEALPFAPQATAERQQYEIYYMEQLRISDSDSADAVDRLRCSMQ